MTNTRAELICAYLDGDAGAVEVLNDALEDSGLSRLAQTGSPGERLALVLEKLISEQLAKRAAVDFAQHVMEHCDRSLAKLVLDYKHTQLEEPVDPVKLALAAQALQEDQRMYQPDLGTLHQLGWSDEANPRSSAAWSVWGALRIPARYVATAAQRVNTTELQWQIEHLKQLLREQP